MMAYLPVRKTPIELNRRDGYVIVTLAWILFSMFGTLPFLLTGSIPGYTDAFFETISGFTTTGASILNNIEELSHAVLFWRSLIQWLGGMGIVVLFVAIFPFLGVGGRQLFRSESSATSTDGIKPKVHETARGLWYIYLSLTLAEVLLLRFGGIGFFDAFCHTFGTVATGGFANYNASIQAFDSA